ncbi:glycosyltransferase family 4 protein [Kocuria sp. UCD-OTCP]|uniref:glycosyltransferase family 4 protein n=1 Tax=Kocuria sp. UCD-OTCP TaxID=1292021 RepID=UPI00037B60DF|nr:glycosyltransferase family 4 protein [Kocuria sp. UCD-OTCP]EYT54172.1 glycosyl transferase group 1 [Kocuria sp. UCD-OTCP]
MPNTPRTLRLLVLTHSYWPEHSPPQRRWSALTRFLVPAGWDVSFLAPTPRFLAVGEERPEGSAWGRSIGPLGERIHRVPYLSARHGRLCKLTDQLFTAAVAAVRGVSTGSFDVILVTAPALPLLASGWLLARLKGVPFVVEMRDAWPNLAEDANLVRHGGKSVVNRVVEFVQNHADLVVTVTEGFATTLRERGVRSVVTVRNGVVLDNTPRVLPPAAQRDRLEVLYLGNHGESQRLENLIEASALVGERMRLTMVGQGSQKPALEALAARLGAPVRFLPPEYGRAVFERYAEADTVVVSLRDDWKSFDATIPSKTYEVLSVGRHITAIVRGEAARVFEDAGEGDVIGGQPGDIARLWQALIADRSRLRPRSSGRAWVAAHADYPDLAARYDSILRGLVSGLEAGRGVASGTNGAAQAAPRSDDRVQDSNECRSMDNHHAA